MQLQAILGKNPKQRECEISDLSLNADFDIEMSL
jgi:hypothetical protein